MDTLAQTHQSTLLSRSVCFLEIEPKQTGLFCCLAPRVSVLLKALPDKLEHTNTHTQGRIGGSASHFSVSWEAARADLKVSSLLVEAGKCEMKTEIPAKRLSGGFLRSAPLWSFHTRSVGGFCLSGCLITKITSQIDFFSLSSPFKGPYPSQADVPVSITVIGEALWCSKATHLNSFSCTD